MADTATVEETEFIRNFPRYRDEAARSKIIVVEDRRRVVGGFLSPDELQRYERLKGREAVSLRIEDLDDEAIAAIEAAEYGKLPD